MVLKAGFTVLVIMIVTQSVDSHYHIRRIACKENFIDTAYGTYATNNPSRFKKISSLIIFAAKGWGIPPRAINKFTQAYHNLN